MRHPVLRLEFGRGNYTEPGYLQVNLAAHLEALDEDAIARANPDYSCDAHVRFRLLTGVSKFPKAILFSSLNIFRDITLSHGCSSICGFTERDLETGFAPELPGLDRGRIRDWYNGYSWGGAEKVYNPFDVLFLLADREFRAWWFETLVGH